MTMVLLSDGDVGFGTLYVPTGMRNVTSDMLICRDETNGSIPPVILFRDDNDVVAMASDTI